MKKIILLLIVAEISLSFVHAAITDTAEELIVPVGETYVLSGSHSYNGSILINGTLRVQTYDGTINSGGLSLSAYDVVIGTSGKIVADGCGYKPGAGPGAGANGNPSGGGGYGGRGGASASIAKGGITYGSILEPMDMGSGGGESGTYSGYGGGKIRIMVNGVFENNGAISCNGGDGRLGSGYDGGGSGGSVYIAAKTVSGAGAISANGGRGAINAGGGGGGRIALYYSADISTGMTVKAYGGQGNQNGGAGTIYKKADSQQYGEVVIDGNNVVGQETYITGQFDGVKIINQGLTISSVSIIIGNLAISGDKSVLNNTGYAKLRDVSLLSGASIYHESGQMEIENDIQIGTLGSLYVDAPLTAKTMEVLVGGIVTHAGQDADFNLTITGDLTIASGGKITADRKGYNPGTGPGAGTNGNGMSSNPAGGGGYGGKAGASTTGSSGGGTYGLIQEPTDLGSGGGQSGTYSGYGGGKIRITVNGMLENNGTISSNGGDGRLGSGYDGGGSGGSVYIVAKTISGSGMISANGGRGAINAGGGGGGRLALYYSTDISTGIVVKSYGGIGNQNGGAGTIYKKAGSQQYGEVMIDGNNVSGKETYITGQFDRVKIINQGLTISSVGITVTNLAMSDNGVLNNTGYAKITNVSLLNGASIYHESGQMEIDNDIQVGSLGSIYVDAPVTAKTMKVMSGGIVTHTGQDADFDLTVTGSLTVASGGKITADKKGYNPGSGPGAGANGNGTASNPAGGGGYGGKGGASTTGSSGGGTYGSILEPAEMGSGGGQSGTYSGYGGGKIRITVNDVLENNGTISSNGGDGRLGSGYDGGGSGGSVYIVAKTIIGAGAISANGGRGAISAGGGGGGRIALYYQNTSYSGEITANGGGNGGNGTVLSNVLSGDSPVALSEFKGTYSRENGITATIAKQNVVLNNTVFRNDNGIIGSIVFSTVTKVEVRTGGFVNNGFFKSELILTIGASAYNCQWKGMSYLDAGERSVFLKGYLGGPVVGAINMTLQESVPGSNNYDIYTGTISITQIGNQLSNDRIVLGGTAAGQNEVEYPNTQMKFSQTNSIGTCSGYNSGNMSITMNCLQIDAADNPYNQEGFAVMSYATEAGSGMIYTYAYGDTTTALYGVITDPLNGYVLGSFDGTKTPEELSLSLSRFNYGEQVQDYLDIQVDPINSVSPGQAVTYNIELKNTGSQDVANIKVVVDLPVEVRFVEASGSYFYHNASEGEWVNYPDPDVAPESIAWQFPSVPANSSMRFSVKAKAKWGITANTILEAVAGIYEYDPDYYNK